MKKRKKDTGLSLQASISEKEKRTVTSGFLAIVPVCYMILGVFGWMKTALGIINVVYDADLLYGVLLAAGIWMGILYLMKKRQFLLLLLTLAVTVILVWMRFSVILEGFAEISRVFQSGMTVPGGVYQGIGSEYEITCALIVVVFLLYDLFFICLSTEIGKYLAVLLLVLPFCAAFVFGQVPDGMGTFCMLLCALGLIASSAEEHDRQRNGSAFFLGILSLLLLLIGFSAGKSLLEPLFEGKEQTRARIQQTSFIKEIEKWTAPLQSQMPQIASGGVSEGTINDADFFLNTGEVLFSVSQDQKPQGSLYLKVYTGTKYSNSRWKANDDPEEKAEIFCQRAAAWSNTQGYDGAVRLTVGFPQGKSDASHPYAPYFSQGMSDDGTEKEYRYYPIERIAYLFTEPADSLRDNYCQYVYEHYLNNTQYNKLGLSAEQQKKQPYRAADNSNASGANPVYMKDLLANGNISGCRYFAQHIWSYADDEGKASMVFAGYGTQALLDYMIYPAASDSRRTISFDIDANAIGAHTLHGYGFLLNAGIDNTGKLVGYVLYIGPSHTGAFKKFLWMQKPLWQQLFQ